MEKTQLLESMLKSNVRERKSEKEMAKIMTKEEYQKLLENHDWYFMMSDDFRVWERGQKNLDKLLRIASQNSEFRNLFNEYQEKYKL